jgi:hypothetical protein
MGDPRERPQKKRKKIKKPRLVSSVSSRIFVKKHRNKHSDDFPLAQTPSNSDLLELSIPQINDTQRQELFQTYIEMMIDARNTYQRTTAALHRQIFDLEEVGTVLISILASLIFHRSHMLFFLSSQRYRALTLIKFSLQNPSNPEDISSLKDLHSEDPPPKDPPNRIKRKRSKTLATAQKSDGDKCKEEKPIEDFAEISAPLEVSHLETLDEAKDFYHQLLLDYLEHQAVLDEMVGAKRQRVQALEAELKAQGWEPSLSPRSSLRRSASIDGDIKLRNRTRSRSVTKSVRSGIIRTGRALSISGERQKSVIMIPKGPTVSEVVYSNKDILSNTKRHTSNADSSTVSIDDFMVMSVIGQGAFGKVYLVVKRKTGQLMAMKVMEKASILEEGDDSLRHVIHELEFMRDMSHHPFIVCMLFLLLFMICSLKPNYCLIIVMLMFMFTFMFMFMFTFMFMFMFMFIFLNRM